MASFKGEGISQEEWNETFDEACNEYENGKITHAQFAEVLLNLGMNASDIVDTVREFKPPGP